MKKLLLRLLLVIIPLLYSIYSWSQPGGKDCSTTCFSSEVVSHEALSETCTAWELRVFVTGPCSHALSHYTVEIPYGHVKDLSNSGGWKQEIGRDPTSGLHGFKIDDIKDFGEQGASSFTVRFTHCASADESNDCWQPRVAYKAATCVNYETLASSCTSPLDAYLVKSDASCGNTADGSLEVTINGGREPYTVEWEDGATTAARTGLSAGHYSVTVTDASGATISLEEQILAPESIVIAGVTSAASCAGLDDGSIDITVSGGDSDYTFAWNNGETSEDITDLLPGVYTVTVTDAAGCAATRTFVINQNNPVTIHGEVIATACDGETGAINITPAGGVAPYAYQWSTGATTEDLSDIGVGVFQVTVTDANGCTAERSYYVQKKSLTISGTVTQPTCQGADDGAIQLGDPLGGTEPYHYTWQDGVTQKDRTNLKSGLYTATVTDAAGCSASLTFLISDPPPCVIQEPAEAPECHSRENILASSVSDAHSYHWSVESSDNSWEITDTNGASITYSAGNENTTATFTLTITRGECTQSCSYTVTACRSEDPEEQDPGDDNEVDPGNDNDEEDPGDEGNEDPGSGDDDQNDGGNDNPNPGDNDPENGDGNCGSCFETIAQVVSATGSCRTYEFEVSTDGLCRHELSHWTIAVPCGKIKDTWNSGGWPFEIGKDPTTGLRGLKVDEITTFGKRPASFTVRFTVCPDQECDLGTWTPLVAYKAGRCVDTEALALTTRDFVQPTAVSIYPNPFSDVLNAAWNSTYREASVQILDQYGSVVESWTGASADHHGTLTFSVSDLPRGIYYYRLTIDGRTYNGKVAKR